MEKNIHVESKSAVRFGRAAKMMQPGAIATADVRTKPSGTERNAFQVKLLLSIVHQFFCLILNLDNYYSLPCMVLSSISKPHRLGCANPGSSIDYTKCYSCRHLHQFLCKVVVAVVTGDDDSLQYT